MDDDYAFFVSRMGAGRQCREVPAAAIARYAQRLPAKLLEYWADFGWCAHGDGLFWVTNPAEYDAVVESWLSGTAFWSPGDNPYHVIARTAFGELYLWGKNTGNDLTVTPQLHMLYHGKGHHQAISQGQEDRQMAMFFATRRKTSLDFEDEQEKPLFDRALKKLGPLAHDQMYALSLARPLGGKVRLEALQKVDLFAQLDLLRQLADPIVVRYP